MTLPGMGPRRAAAVVLHRVRHGYFADVTHLVEVDGIGPVTVEEWRPYLVDPPALNGAGRVGKR